MIADVNALEQTQLERALCALFLLPSAPSHLVDAVYAALQRDGAATGELRDAYETVVAAAHAGALATPSNGHGGTPFRHVNPWQILHLRSDAPRAAIDAAYWLWRGDAPPVVATDPVAATFRSARAEPAVPQPEPGPAPLAAEGSINDQDVLSLIEDFAVLSVYEELLGEAPAGDVPPPRVGEGPGEGSQLSAYEELLHVSAQPGSPPHIEERQGVRADPTLTAADGTTLALADRPLRIGTHPACDVVVRAAGRIEARVWRNKGRVLVHALGERGAVRLNGEPVTWAVLDGGDALVVGPASFRFASPKTT
jgi:hypothetical protein